MGYVELNTRNQLNEVLVTLVGETDKRQILKGVIEGVMNVFRSPFSLLVIVDPSKKRIENFWLVSRRQDTREISPPQEIDLSNIPVEGYWDFIDGLIRDQSPMLINDLSIIVDPLIREYAERILKAYKLVTYALIPIHSVRQGEPLGGIVIGLRRNLSRDELQVVKEFSEKLARMLDFAEKVKEANFRDREAKLLLSLLKNVTTGDIERNLNQVVKHLVELLNADMSAIGEYIAEKDVIKIIAAYGKNRERVMDVEIALKNCPRIKEAFERREPFQIKEDFANNCVPGVLKELLKFAILLKIPMFDSGGNPLGMLFVMNHDKLEYDETEIAIAERFAEMAALAIEKFRISQELLDAREYLNAVFNSQQDILIVIDVRSFTIKDVNRRFFEVFGLRGEEVVGDSLEIILEGKLPVETLKEAITRVLKHKRGITLRNVKGVIDGKTSYFDIVLSPIYRSGRISDVLFSIRDVTREIELEEKIEAINALGRELLLIRDPMKVADSVCDIAERVLEFKEFMLALLDEYRAELRVYAIRGKEQSYRFGQSVPSSDNCAFNALIYGEVQNFPVGKSGYPEICVPIKVKDKVIGVIKVVSASHREFDENDQRLLLALASQTGMAMENARLFVRLGESERRYRLLLDNANDAIFVLEQRGIVRQANKMASELTGYDKSELIGKHIEDLFIPAVEGTPPLPDPNNRKGTRLEGFLIAKKGERIPVEWSASAVPVKSELLFLGIARDLREQKRAEKVFKSLNAAALAVMRHLSEKEIFAAVGRELGKLGFRSAVLLADMKKSRFVVKYVSDGASGMLFQKIPMSQMPELLEVIKKNTALPIKRPLLPLSDKPAIAAPLTRNGKPYGLLVVFAERISERDVPAISLFAHQVAIALENASLYQEIKVHAENLSKILRLSVSINAVPSMEETLKVLTSMTAQVMHIPFAFVALYDESLNALKGMSPSFGLPAELFEDTVIPLSNKSLASEVFRTGKLIFINDVRGIDFEFKSIADKLDLRRLLVTPLKVENRILGVFYLGKRSHDPPFTENEARVFAILANHAATAIRNAQLFDELKLTLNKLEHTYDITLEALVSALDFREHETQFHSQRVAKYSERIAIELGIQGEDLRYIYWGSLLHDVGKIGIPDAILLKPGKLNDQEWEIMKKHPLIGFKIVETIDFLGPARDIVLYHHERWDGRGYPFGLKEEEIPLGARIFAFADTLDAITSDRPYRKALGFDYAIQEIARNKGKQFDPYITDVFLSIPVEEWKIIRQNLMTKSKIKTEKPYVTPRGEKIPEIEHIIKW